MGELGLQPFAVRPDIIAAGGGTGRRDIPGPADRPVLERYAVLVGQFIFYFGVGVTPVKVKDRVGAAVEDPYRTSPVPRRTTVPLPISRQHVVDKIVLEHSLGHAADGRLARRKKPALEIINYVLDLEGYQQEQRDNQPGHTAAGQAADDAQRGFVPAGKAFGLGAGASLGSAR